MKEFIGFVVFVLIVVLILRYAVMRPPEHMTNAEVQSAMQTYGTPDTSKKIDVSKYPIYGPTVDKSEIEAARQNKFHPKKPKAANYPQIYGPDLIMVPGTKSGSDDDMYFGINPDLKTAFPTDGPPQPYLSDFSKFQH